MNGRLMLLHGLTPIHTGTGQSVDVIDLPVAREKTTFWPYLPGSSLKGVLRDACEPISGNKSLWIAAFGPKTENTADGAGMLLFCDARLLCLPVRSFKGTFAWVTCPSVLHRVQRDLKAVDGMTLPEVPAMPVFDRVMTCQGSVVRIDDKLYLEDLDVTAPQGDATPIAMTLARWAFTDAGEQKAFIERFALVSDDLFTFLTETATEVTARIAIDEKVKTVKDGHLWYEEALPAESLFWSLILAAPRNETPESELFAVLNPALSGLLQIGGHAGVGRGLVRAYLQGGA